MRILKHIKNVILLLYRTFIVVPLYILFVMVVGTIMLSKEFVRKTFLFAVKEYKYVFKRFNK